MNSRIEEIRDGIRWYVPRDESEQRLVNWLAYLLSMVRDGDAPNNDASAACSAPPVWGTPPLQSPWQAYCTMTVDDAIYLGLDTLGPDGKSYCIVERWSDGVAAENIRHNTEPPCHCLTPALHTPDCAWKQWKDNQQ